MIVVVSDLHLQHTSRDTLRYRTGDGSVHEIGVRRNVSEAALQLLLDEIAGAAQGCAETLEIVFAGDIFELYRTPSWFEGGRTLRPTPEDPTSDPALEQFVLGLFDRIENDNRAFFKTLRDLVLEKGYSRGGVRKQLDGVENLVIHYLPGNHDRLANAWPSVRSRVRGLLAIAAPKGEEGAPFAHVLERPASGGGEYGVRIRHGHEYDKYNSRFDRIPAAGDPAYLLPCFGDYVTIDIAARLAVAFRVRFSDKLREESAEGDLFRKIYLALTEFDDVRPQAMLPVYLSSHLGVTEEGIFTKLRPILRDVYEHARSDPFFQREAARTGVGKYFDGLAGTALSEALQHVSGAALARVLDALPKTGHAVGKDGPAMHACEELDLANGEVSLVIAGHTHEADTVAMPGAGRAPAFYLDSGTWRTRMEAGVRDAFGRSRTYTMVFCYAAEERQQWNDKRRFETWTGHLGAEDFGPYQHVVEAALVTAKRQLRLTRVHVDRIDEGDEGGAELRLVFGVDGQILAFERKGITNGADVDISALDAIPLDPDLDGEIVCWGVEKDSGNDARVDPDDPLPWAIGWLARDANGAFTTATGQVTLQDAQTHVTVEWAVETAS